jgi:hypothetical protein
MAWNMGPTYVENALKPFRGVFGPLVSCTVSKVGAPLTPLCSRDVFAFCADCLSSLSNCWSISGRLSVDVVGVACCTTIFGALCCVLNEFRLLPDGGGDFSLGDIGQEGVVLSLGVPDVVMPLAGLDALEAGSDVVAGCS